MVLNLLNCIIDFLHREGVSMFNLDSSYNVEPPPVKKTDQLLYEKYIQTGVQGASDVSDKDVKFYTNYVYHFNK